MHSAVTDLRHLYNLPTCLKASNHKAVVDYLVHIVGLRNAPYRLQIKVFNVVWMDTDTMLMENLLHRVWDYGA